jgi:glycosyltransferase involved in cell wall biosynthesis
VNFIGHGIPIERFSKLNFEVKREGIASIGRIVRIKNIEEGIKAIGVVENIPRTLHLYGEPLGGDDYLESINQLAITESVELKLHGLVNYESMPMELQKYSVVYSGTPKSTDKALLEAAAAGCFPLTNNRDAESLTGMVKVWKFLRLDPSASLATKLSALTKLSEREEIAFRKQVSMATCASSDVKATVGKISDILRNN